MAPANSGGTRATDADARLAGILAIAADAIISIDDQQRITLFNDGAEAIFGYARAEVLGEPIDLLIPERFRGGHRRHIDKFGATSVASRRMGERQQILGRRKDGSEFPAEASIARLQLGDQLTYTVVMRDVTERKQAEEALARSKAELEMRVEERTAALSAEIRRREETQAQLMRTQRMEAFGQLTGGVAHDFNNLLTVITGNLELLEMRLADPRDRAILKRAQDASEMGARLTSRLLTFARRRRLASAPIDLNDQIIGMVELLERALGEPISLTTRLSPNLWTVNADPSEIENAVLNLAINARDAMPKGGQLILETSNVTADTDQIGTIDKLAAGDYVRLSVSDTGAGMSPDVLGRVFEPFFTTKGPGKGTGLGLSTIYGFVQSSGGTATVYSEPARGTTVSLYLPRHGEEPAPSQRTEAATTPLSAGETVLLVEDNADVRHVMHEQLESLGYRVLDADSGPAALAVLGSPAAIELVLSDVVMAGGMSGFDVARAVRSSRPGLAVLLTSGYAEDVLREERGEMAGLSILRKPCSRQELALAVRRAIDGADAPPREGGQR